MFNIRKPSRISYCLSSLALALISARLTTLDRTIAESRSVCLSVRPSVTLVIHNETVHDSEILSYRTKRVYQMLNLSARAAPPPEMEPGQQYWPETRPDPGLTDPWPVSTRWPGWPGNVYAQVNIIYSNLAPRPRPYNLSLMNIVEVSAGNISPVYCYNIAEALQYDMRQLRRTWIETVDSLLVPVEPNTLTVTAHQ